MQHSTVFRMYLGTSRRMSFDPDCSLLRRRNTTEVSYAGIARRVSNVHIVAGDWSCDRSRAATSAHCRKTGGFDQCRNHKFSLNILVMSSVPSFPTTYNFGVGDQFFGYGLAARDAYGNAGTRGQRRKANRNFVSSSTR